MLCQNCNEREANVKYTQIINGEKKEMMLCEKCSKELGIDSMNFNIPINFSSFLGDFLEDYAETGSFLPGFLSPVELKCKNCGSTYEDFINSGMFGCSDCYNVFSNRIDPILKNIHGANMHIGRRGKLTEPNLSNSGKNKAEGKDKNSKKEKMSDSKDQLTLLKEQLNQAIREERYEDAASLRDEIKKLENK
ncbi:MAG: UvrB/UvrC motif-containing protein [Clostridia bacterium]